MSARQAKITVTRQQMALIRSQAFETLFGGAAGGGKTYALAIDALVFAAQYPRSRQLVLRRTMPELERSLIPVTLAIYPQAVGKFVKSERVWQLVNGSVIEFGYCDAETDVTRYQSAEYDVIRFDELTHFTEYQYAYLISRIRGANPYPKQVKSATNPGGVGHSWVKRRFVDAAPAGQITRFPGGTRLFLPARAQDNHFLMRRDPAYLERLQNLPDRDRLALREGVWEIPGGKYFPEFSREIHVVKPFDIPRHWRRWLAIDYGLDMLAALWIAQAPDGRAVVYREVYESGLILSEAARRIAGAEDEDEPIYARLAPPDLWSRRQETGQPAIDIFAAAGLYFEKSDNRRVPGWYAVKELLHVRQDGGPRLTIFDTCLNLIRTLPALGVDPRNPNDAANTPHELTHAPDALRAFALSAMQPCGEQSCASPFEDEVRAFLTF